MGGNLGGLQEGGMGDGERGCGTCTASSSDPMRRRRWGTTPDWCIVTQFQGSCTKRSVEYRVSSGIPLRVNYA